jgi:bis(5'-nucleosyl)-tetraphosphatase (symmetrical)
MIYIVCYGGTMSVYCIGDVHACLKELRELLNVMEFSPQDDELIFTGDIIGRGPEPLDTIHFIQDLGDRAHMVLGNHDLNLLAVVYGYHEPKKKDKLDSILTAPDLKEITNWFRKQPLLYINQEYSVCTVHAGITPQWNITTAVACAREMEQVIQDDLIFPQFLQRMYDDRPSLWSEDLKEFDRWRFITNVFTRIRLCYTDKSLNLSNKNSPEEAAGEGLVPWYTLLTPGALDGDKKYRLVFGHWAALTGKCNYPGIKSLDTGCVWGNKLTAWCCDTDIMYSVPSRQPAKFA